MWVPLLLALAAVAQGHEGQESTLHYTNEWVVRVEGGREAAYLVAEEMGYTCLGQVAGFPDTYRMVKTDHPPQHKRGFRRLTQRLVRDARVVWAEQQFAKERTKRRAMSPLDGNRLLRRVKRDDLAEPEQRERLFDDELWEQEWYLQDTRTRSDLPKLDLHVLPLYRQGISGRGIRVTVLDDGLEHRHEDLRDNYDPEISYDANDDDNDPTPRYDPGYTNAHGTRCAGEIAMTANNGKCGVGVAFNARIGGVRLLDGPVTDRVEGAALGWAHHLVDVYSASWGPSDDGRTVEGPGRLATEAIDRGIREGRGGKGAIFVWASGNGGGHGDNCDCDGYAGSIYTLSVGSASQRGHFPWYGERCASTMAATYSSGAYTDQMIATTDLGNRCTIRHTGTSASAPLAAGIIALALEVNPELTWRDVQHLVVWTSQFAPLSDNEGWQRNGAGLWVNTRFGFGLMDAAGLVGAAANWTNVPVKTTCSVVGRPRTNTTVAFGLTTSVDFDASTCMGDAEINFLEHVELVADISYTRRGSLELFLTSPAGTRIQLLSPRRYDTSQKGFKSWRFMSALTWGEQPRGFWVADLTDQVGPTENKGRLNSMTLVLHGTKDQPAYLNGGARKYDRDYNRVHRKTALSNPEPTTLDDLQAIKGKEPLDWRDLVDVPVVVRALADRLTHRRSWMRSVFGV